ncbi:MAG: DUF47 family protein [Candidatus Bathyarchaeota archaeon]|nr:DUF47 family protein [Candidatus Bathyarchaeota archaeon]
MVFPRDTEEQARRMVLGVCQDHIRKVLQGVRELTAMVDDFASGKNPEAVGDRLARIRGLKEEAAGLKRGLLKELAEVGMLLMSRDDVLRLVTQVNQIVEMSEEAAFRVSEIVKKKMDLNEEILEGFLNIAKNVLRAVTNLRETILSLKYGRERTIELAGNVEIAEYVVDEIYRDLDMKIIDTKMDVNFKLLLREAALFLENIADKAEEATDSVRILAISF